MKGQNLEKSNAIIQFLREHPLISRNALCAMTGYDVSNLSKIIAGNGPYVSIPAKYLDEFERILSDYGFEK